MICIAARWTYPRFVAADTHDIGSIARKEVNKPEPIELLPLLWHGTLPNVLPSGGRA